ncbi:fungal specific transcription factor domain-containing protein [Hirsutella rhossiliensis]|uniref:Fungal specific transcription factor domain-containing protein n=1 Tax=Hirsutella rhossiliensis TaxID=111463 RepID=A0A9P8MS36_9HYPO|nr:fungal specific transcription factor domain-containing protein [Hirsutella rhossiliensis]KAH0960022.1 fungal specific transcription factor domain-containing protein [Hirsutella rhossiliensis]
MLLSPVMSGDMSDDDAGPLSVADWQLPDAPSPADSAHSDAEFDDRAATDPSAPSQPIQKRRRVTRACDECRRKKIKCDGKQPCTHCSVYSYECTYDKPSNRRRNPAPQYIEALENRLQRAENMLRKFMPDVDLADPNLDPAIQQEFHNRQRARAHAAKLRASQADEPSTTNDAKLITMIDSIGQLDLDDKGGWDFHGTSSGAVFLRRMKDHFRGMLGPMSKAPFLPRPDRPPGLVTLDSPSPGGNSPFSAMSSYPELPSKDVARKLCYYSLSCATCLVRIIHVPSFTERFEQIYDRPLDSLNQEDTHFLGLVYAVLALGCMYNNLDDAKPESGAYKAAIDEGLKYYKTARALLHDLAECRDIVSLQALLFMILFLQATSNLSLHRHLQHEKIGVLEQEIRRRVFYVIRQMDIYVSTMLGFPLLLNIDDVDQLYPTEVDDEYISSTGIISPPPGTPSFFEAFNAQTRLMEILGKIAKHVYPMHGQGQPVVKGDKSSTTYLISYARIKEIETELQGWYEKLPEMWRPSPDGAIEVVRVRHLLRFAYAHVQLVLYRPFLHYISPRLSQTSKVDELSYACAAAAISVSRNIVHIGLEIRKQGVLSGPYWFMLYTEFFAILSLVFYAIENPDKPGTQEVLADAQAGRQMIADLADKSMSADRVTNALKPLFDQLPGKLEQARTRPTPSRKRPAAATGAESGLSHHAPVTPSLSTQRADDFLRAGPPTRQTAPFASPNSQTSADTTESVFPDLSFAASVQDIIPMDLSSRATPDSTSTGSSHRHRFLSQSLGIHGAHNPVNKLDSLMFPSDDPFAYPNQPMMELGFQPKAERPAVPMAAPGQDTPFFFPTSFDEIGDQLLNYPPPYMMQQQQQRQQQQQQQQQQLFGLTGNPYDPHNMLAMHTAQHHQQQPQASQSQPQLQTRSHIQQQSSAGIFSGFRRARADRQQVRQIEQMFTQQGMQPDWGSFFGSGRGGFQGM